MKLLFFLLLLIIPAVCAMVQSAEDLIEQIDWKQAVRHRAEKDVITKEIDQQTLFNTKCTLKQVKKLCKKYAAKLSTVHPKPAALVAINAYCQLFSLIDDYLGPYQSNTRLLRAIVEDDIEKIKELLEEGANPNSCTAKYCVTDHYYYFSSALQYALCNAGPNSYDIVQLLIAKGAYTNQPCTCPVNYMHKKYPTPKTLYELAQSHLDARMHTLFPAPPAHKEKGCCSIQ